MFWLSFMMSQAFMQMMLLRLFGEFIALYNYYVLTHRFNRTEVGGSNPIRSKYPGRLIHVSDFINEETGCLVVLNPDGSIKRDARKIIYPGSGHDPWWDHAQFLAQV